MKVCVFTLGCKVNRYESDVIINKSSAALKLPKTWKKPIITS